MYKVPIQWEMPKDELRVHRQSDADRVVVQREGRDSVARRDERTHVAVLAGQRETAAHLKHMINIDN